MLTSFSYFENIQRVKCFNSGTDRSCRITKRVRSLEKSWKRIISGKKWKKYLICYFCIFYMFSNMLINIIWFIYIYVRINFDNEFIKYHIFLIHFTSFMSVLIKTLCRKTLWLLILKELQNCNSKSIFFPSQKKGKENQLSNSYFSK